MQKQFVQYINQQKLFSDTNTLLVAVSGGVDSIVLLHLLVQGNYKVKLAHCNFNLRGNESDNDEHFVKQLAKDLNIQTHIISFDTINYAKKNKLSIEMAARDLRYSWFNELLVENNYKYIVTGHHLNDSIETLFLNLARGTGYNGLTGISPKNGVVVRPLLFATRQAIENYAADNKLSYRNDSSNESEKHLRNIVRKYIIPAFKQLNPSFEQVMTNNFSHINEAATLLNSYFDSFASESLKNNNNNIEIPFSKLLSKEPLKIHLYQLIKDFGFNNDAVIKIIDAFDANPGKMFYSESHCLLIDRASIIITEKTRNEKQCFFINSLSDFNNLPIKIRTEKLDGNDFEMIKKSNFACIDFSKLNFPLELRKWEQGDSFHPLGMTQKKKISDFLIDTKVNRLEKENVWVLISNNEVVWVVSKRLDNRFKVTEETKDVLILEYMT